MENVTSRQIQMPPSPKVLPLFCELYSGESPQDVIDLEPDFLSEVGITQHLSPNRRNGLTGVGIK